MVWVFSLFLKNLLLDCFLCTLCFELLIRVLVAYVLCFDVYAVFRLPLCLIVSFL